MTHELFKRLSALRGITPRLNSVTDQVSEIVRSVEKTLVEELKIGIDASEWFLSEAAGEPGVSREHSLAFSRVGTAGYRINVSIVTVRDAPKEEGEPAPARRLNEERILWQSCSRELKLKAFEKLPALLDSIIKSAEALLKTADDTATKIKEMLGDAEFVPPPKEKEDAGKRPLFGRSPLLENIIKGAEGWIQTADETAAKFKDIFGDTEPPAAPRQESRRRSRFSRAPRRAYSVQDAMRAHRQYFLDQGINEAALNSVDSQGWVETGPAEFVCYGKGGTERCGVIFVDEEGSAEVKFADGESETVTIEEE